MQLKMSFTIEKVLADARTLVNRLKEHDGAADNLIAVSQTMYRRVDSMRQYQEDLNELNEIARHRPRANLIMGLVQENTQIRELQQENKELRACLEEHQSAIELIMSKYREQMVKLLMANKLDNNTTEENSQAVLVEQKVDKIVEMAAVMQKAIRVDETESMRDREHIAQLETENKTLRELLMIGYNNSGELSKMDRSVQVDLPVESSSFNSSGNLDTESIATTDDEDHHFVSNDMNSSVIENKSFKLENFIQQSGIPVNRASRTTESVSSTDSSLNESMERISVNDVTVNIKSNVTSNQGQDKQLHHPGKSESNVSGLSQNQENSVQECSSSQTGLTNEDNCNNVDSDSTIKSNVPTTNGTESESDIKENIVSKDVNANTGNSSPKSSIEVEVNSE